MKCVFILENIVLFVVILQTVFRIHLHRGESTYEYNEKELLAWVRHERADTSPYLTEDFRIRETSYLLDYGSGTNNELAGYEKGKGEFRYTYGPSYERVNGKVVLEAG